MGGLLWQKNVILCTLVLEENIVGKTLYNKVPIAFGSKVSYGRNERLIFLTPSAPFSSGFFMSGGIYTEIFEGWDEKPTLIHLLVSIWAFINSSTTMCQFK